MAKANYSFEKRQRDLAKKRKQEAKRLRKLAGKAAAGDGAPGALAEPPPPASDEIAAGGSPPDAAPKPEG